MPPEATTGPLPRSTEGEASLLDAFDAALPGISPGVFDEADFRAISEIVHKETGIILPTGKAALVFARLSPRVRNTNCATFASYVIRIREDVAERRRAICALTTSHTAFYQQPRQFEHFGQTVRPGYVQRLLNGGKVRLWSAGCGNGAEAWSLLMTLLGDDVLQGETLARADLRLLATDMSAAAIETAREATYRNEDLKPLPETLRRAWTQPGGEQSTIARHIQQIARFRTLKLLGEWPMEGQFDTIFCRNTRRQFDKTTREQVVLRLARQLTSGGWLYLEDGEAISGAVGGVLEKAGPAVFQKAA